MFFCWQRRGVIFACVWKRICCIFMFFFHNHIYIYLYTIYIYMLDNYILNLFSMCIHSMLTPRKNTNIYLIYKNWNPLSFCFVDCICSQVVRWFVCMYSCNAFKHENANNHKTRFEFNIFGAYRFFHHNKCHIINHVASKAWMNVLHQYYLDQGSEVERWGSREPKPNKESQQDGPVSKISPAAQVKTGDRSLSLMVNVQDSPNSVFNTWGSYGSSKRPGG